jgi:hypothetical protein
MLRKSKKVQKASNLLLIRLITFAAVLQKALGMSAFFMVAICYMEWWYIIETTVEI